MPQRVDDLPKRVDAVVVVLGKTTGLNVRVVVDCFVVVLVVRMVAVVVVLWSHLICKFDLSAQLPASIHENRRPDDSRQEFGSMSILGYNEN
mgnify:CR=1 FL=1